MPCGTKLSSNKNAKSDLTLTPDKLDYFLFQGSDAEKRALWLEWFSAAQDKHATVRRETELSFK